MKNLKTLFGGILVCSIFSLCGCSSPNDEELTVDPKINSVSLETALTNIGQYSRWWKVTPDSMHYDSRDSTLHFDPIKISNPQIIQLLVELQRQFPTGKIPFFDENSPAIAHTITREELLGALNSGGKEHASIRVYNGIDLSDNEIKTRLYMVPVDSFGKDIIPDESGQSVVYNLTLPCPNSCDTESLLYKASTREFRELK